jgi:hypothetical protein
MHSMFQPGVNGGLQPGACASSARLESTPVFAGNAVMKTVLAVVVCIVVLGACAEGGSGSASGAGTGSVTMYGTIDEGITFHK